MTIPILSILRWRLNSLDWVTKVNDNFPVDKKTLDYVLNLLRQGTIKWDGRKRCLRRARKLVHDGTYYQNGNPIKKYFWKCAKCKQWFRDESEMEVDHVVEIGPFNGDLHNYADRMYPEDPNALQALCVLCHSKKTATFNATARFTRKKKLPAEGQ